MAESPNLSDELLRQVRDVLDRVRVDLSAIAQGNPKTLHHARRHLMKQLEFDECGTPVQRSKLKLTLMAKQQGKCVLSGKALPPRDSELDREDPMLGYIEENCTLIHHECHRKSQASKNYA